MGLRTLQKMIRLAFFITLLCTSLVISTSTMAASSEDQPTPSSEQPSSQEPCECKGHPTACQVNQTLDEIENQVEELSDSYQDGSIWDLDGNGHEVAETSGKRALRQVLLVPSYIMRFFTWPLALSSDFLIKKGVARHVVNAISNDDRTLWVYPKFELGFGSGFGMGLGVRHVDLMHEGYCLSAGYLANLNLNQRGEIKFGKANVAELFGRPLSFLTTTSLKHDKIAPFYGRGIESQSEEKAYYKWDALISGGLLSLEMQRNLYLRFHLFVEADSTHPGEGKEPSVNERFAAGQLPGFGRELVYANVGLKLIHDDRNALAAPESGGVRSLAISRLQGLGTTHYDYNAFHLDLLQYIRLWFPRHVLALRNSWIFQQRTGSIGIPFFRLASLDVNSPARGFSSGRFRDSGNVVFNVEYRFPVWKYLDGQLFFDTGRVFDGITDVSFKHFRFDGGAGFRFRTKNFFLFRAQIGYGGEGVKFLFKTSQAF